VDVAVLSRGGDRQQLDRLRTSKTADEAIAVIREHHGRWLRAQDALACPPDGGR
jgi:hypothetical protein